MLCPYCRATSVFVLAGDRVLYDLQSKDPNDDECEQVNKWTNTNSAEG